MWPYDTPGQSNQLNQQLQTLMSQQIVGQASIHVTKVNGRNGAEAFNMPANSDVLLLDANDPIVWFVQTDGAGYKSITPYDISLHKEKKEEDRFQLLEDRITKLEEALANGKSNHPKSNWSKSGSGTERNDAGSRSDDKG